MENNILKQYNEDGFILIRNLLSMKEIQSIQDLRKRIDTEAEDGGFQNFIKGKTRYEIERIETDGMPARSTLRAVKDPWWNEEAFRNVTGSDKILDIVEKLIGSEIYYHSSKLFFKAARGGRRKPWHQDWAYWDNMNQRQVTVWMAIDEATRENGCIEVIPGSHKNGLIKHHHGEDFMIEEDGIDSGQIIYAVMKPGDVLFFDVLTLHASAANHSDKGRLCCIIDYDSEPKPENSKHGTERPLRSREGEVGSLAMT